MVLRFSQEQEGCDLCERQDDPTFSLVVKELNAVWYAEICDDCAASIQEAQTERFGDPNTDPRSGEPED